MPTPTRSPVLDIRHVGDPIRAGIQIPRQKLPASDAIAQHSPRMPSTVTHTSGYTRVFASEKDDDDRFSTGGAGIAAIVARWRVATSAFNSSVWLEKSRPKGLSLRHVSSDFIKVGSFRHFKVIVTKLTCLNAPARRAGWLGGVIMMLWKVLSLSNAQGWGTWLGCRASIHPVGGADDNDH